MFALRWLMPCPLLMLRFVGLGGVFYAPSGNAFSRWLLSAISNFRWERPAKGFFALFSQLVDASVFPTPLLLVDCCIRLGVYFFLRLVRWLVSCPVVQRRRWRAPIPFQPSIPAPIHRFPYHPTPLLLYP